MIASEGLRRVIALATIALAMGAQTLATQSVAETNMTSSDLAPVTENEVLIPVRPRD